MWRLLLAALPLAACHARLDDARSGADLSTHAPGPVAIDLGGGWAFTYDGAPTNYPMAVVTAASADSVTVAYGSALGHDCGCSAQHLVIALPRRLPCDATTMSFDWSHGGPLDDFASTALRIDFNPGGNDDTGDAGQFIGSTWHGSSGCAWRPDFMGRFPAATAVTDGHNEVALGDLAARRAGDCRGDFDLIDVHVEGYDCAGPGVTATLANLVLR